jgi:post-segregation antitoxin (ccd killing protein)
MPSNDTCSRRSLRLTQGATTRCVYIPCVARVNIYLPDDLAAEARAEGLNVSGVCREAIEASLRMLRQKAWLAALQDHEPIEIPLEEIQAAVHGAQADLGLRTSTDEI